MKTPWRRSALPSCWMAIVISTVVSPLPRAAAVESLCAINKCASGDARTHLCLSGRQRRDPSRHERGAGGELGAFPARAHAMPKDGQTVLALVTAQDQHPSPPEAPTNTGGEEMAGAKDALAILIRFPDRVAKTRLVVSQFSSRAILGTVGYEVRCSYCSSRFLWCWETTTQTFHGGKDLGLDPELRQILRSAEEDSKQFSGDFYPRLRRWLRLVPPMIGSEIESAAAELRHIQAQASAGAVSPSQQQVRVAKCLSPANQHLRGAARQLKSMMGELASYLQRQNAYQQDLMRAKERFEDSVRQELKAQVEPLPCGQQEATNQLNQSKQHAEEALKTLNSDLDELKSRTAEADEAGSKLLGTLMNFVNRFQFISEQLKTARDAESLNRQIQSLHLNIAVQAWKDFAEYAAQQAK